MRKMQADPRSIKVLHNKAIIKDIKPSETESGLYIPETQDKKQFTSIGEVITATDNVTDSHGKVLYEIGLKADDKVIYDKRSAQITLVWEGIDYFIIRAEDIFCVL